MHRTAVVPATTTPPPGPRDPLQMVDVIKWCFELGVRYVSVYAFSIDNFRRGADEVEGLMRLAADKFEELMRVRPMAGVAGAAAPVAGPAALSPCGGAASQIAQAQAGGTYHLGAGPSFARALLVLLFKKPAAAHSPPTPLGRMRPRDSGVQSCVSWATWTARRPACRPPRHA
jgi:hypothetical protein